MKCTNDFEEDLGYKEMQIYVDVIAILLLNNVENIEKQNLNTETTNILQVTANILPEFLKYFEVGDLKIIPIVQIMQLQVIFFLGNFGK